MSDPQGTKNIAYLRDLHGPGRTAPARGTILTLADFGEATTTALKEALRSAGKSRAAVCALHLPDERARPHETDARLWNRHLGERLWQLVIRLTERPFPPLVTVAVHAGGEREVLAFLHHHVRPDLVIAPYRDGGRAVGQATEALYRHLGCPILLMPSFEDRSPASRNDRFRATDFVN
jgi:Universal stress protein family